MNAAGAAVPKGGAKRRGKRGRHRANRKRGDGLRTCISCGLAAESQTLLRLMVIPGGAVHIDVRGKGGGRGCYVCASQKCLTDIGKKKKLQRALREPNIVAEPQSLLVEASRGIKERLNQWLTLAQKSGRMVSGAESVQRSLKKSDVAMLLISDGVSLQTREKVEGWSKVHHLDLYDLPLDLEEFGSLLGKAPRAVGAVRRGELARCIEVELVKWKGLMAV